MAKLPDAIEYINNVLESVHKVVIFARHRDVINKLYQQYSDMAVKVMGGMSDVEKDESVQRFQTDVDVRVFIGAVAVFHGNRPKSKHEFAGRLRRLEW
jgi:short-subunit dehydrogenase